MSVAPVFTKITEGTYAGSYSSTMRLLGTSGATPVLEGSITFTSVSGLQPISFTKNLHEFQAFSAFNSDKKTPMALAASL